MDILENPIVRLLSQGLSMMLLQHYQSAKLPGLVEMIWEQYSDQPMQWRILPSGKVELIFCLSELTNVQAKNIDNHNNPTRHFCFLSGLHTRPLYMSFERFHFVGVQLSPLAVKTFFGLPAQEVLDGAIEGALLLDEVHRIEDVLRTFTSFQERAQWLENELLSRIKETPELHMAMKLSAYTKELAYRRFFQDGEKVELNLGYSRTQTYRIFKDWFGVSSGSYLRLLQFVQTIHFLHENQSNLTTIGLQKGYFDQSHFIRSFKDFADMTPGEYRAQKTDFPGQLSY